MTRTVRAAAAGAVVALLLGACAKPEPEPIAVSGDELPVAGTVKLQVDAPNEEGEVGPVDITYKLEVPSPLSLTMAATGLEVVPAGELRHGTGHFHLSWTELDPQQDASRADSVCTPVGEPFDEDDTSIDFADAEATATLELDPGLYRVCLQLGDGEHTSLNPREEYTIVVVEPGATTTTEVEAVDETPTTFSTIDTSGATEGPTTTATPGTLAPTTTVAPG